ncbi:hypothetical protein PLANPX_0265 [Lacipirellula parvula]|uniref:Uncharacterized protein n=1 Tax=Lacipirellula parvula TaxID=2650471 RepID=A0A5K7X886_9BACT|nr:hypothetical protein PLANPX_0265 [Lacipirellula parvula]
MYEGFVNAIAGPDLRGMASVAEDISSIGALLGRVKLVN